MTEALAVAPGPAAGGLVTLPAVPTEPTPGHPRPSRTVPRSLAEIAAAAGVGPPAGHPSSGSVDGVTLDSRRVCPGDLYAALPGAYRHGAEFAADAAASGAVAILTDPAGAAAAGRTGLPVLVVADPRAVLGPVSVVVYGPGPDVVLGVTGTNGKTTVAHLLDAGLRALGVRTGLIGTVETRVDDVALPSARTTPEAPDLRALLAVMAERGVEAVSMEVSSHALTLERVGGTRFTVGAFTNLSQDHLDFHADLEDYFAAKARLFDGRSDHEVVMVDDGWGRRLVGPGTVTVSATGRPAAWRAVDVTAVPGGGSSFTVHGPDGPAFAASVRLPGGFNVANALLALAVLGTAGYDAPRAAAGVARATVPGRLEPVEAGHSLAAFVDYAHTPDAVATLLAALRPGTPGRLIVVLGCGGDRDRDKRPLMGAAAARGADLVVVTDDNPRSEDPAVIRAAVRRGAELVGAGAEVREVGGRRAAIEAAVAAAVPGDTIVVAGKGHEQGQEAGGVLTPFDDRVVLRAALTGAAR